MNFEWIKFNAPHILLRSIMTRASWRIAVLTAIRLMKQHSESSSYFINNGKNGSYGLRECLPYSRKYALNILSQRIST